MTGLPGIREHERAFDLLCALRSGQCDEAGLQALRAGLTQCPELWLVVGNLTVQRVACQLLRMGMVDAALDLQWTVARHHAHAAASNDEVHLATAGLHWIYEQSGHPRSMDDLRRELMRTRE